MSNGAAVFNERLLYPTYEIINGTKYRILASTPYHCYIMLNIFYSIFNYCKENKDGYVFFHGAEVKFSEENIFQPDIVVVKTENKNIIDWKKSINGAPDLVVEVFSRSTMKKDLIVKKDTYEKFGVKEYWIVNPYMQSISVYTLLEGKYELDSSDYVIYNDEEWRKLNAKQKAASKTTISPAIFPEIKIRLIDIFSWRY